MNRSDVNLYLVGFMGTGKTTVGRLLAQKIGFDILDSDKEIEKKEGSTISDIFSKQGEAAFRGMEKEFILNGHPITNAVISCGGGLVVQPGMKEELQSRGVVVCLHASIETILERTKRQNTRPLLAVDDPDKQVRMLYSQREPIYKSSGTVVLTDQRPIKDIVAHVYRIWEREAAEFARFHS